MIPGSPVYNKVMMDIDKILNNLYINYKNKYTDIYLDNNSIFVNDIYKYTKYKNIKSMEIFVTFNKLQIPIYFNLKIISLDSYAIDDIIQIYNNERIDMSIINSINDIIINIDEILDRVNWFIKIHYENYLYKKQQLSLF